MPQNPVLNVNATSQADALAKGVSQVMGTDFGPTNAPTLVIVMDVTTLTGTSLQLQLELFDSASGKFIAWGAAFTAVVAASTVCYVVAIAAGAAAGGITAVLSQPVPQRWRIRVIPVAITAAIYTVTTY